MERVRSPTTLLSRDMGALRLGQEAPGDEGYCRVHTYVRARAMNFLCGCYSTGRLLRPRSVVYIPYVRRGVAHTRES